MTEYWCELAGVLQLDRVHCLQSKCQICSAASSPFSQLTAMQLSEVKRQCNAVL